MLSNQLVTDVSSTTIKAYTICLDKMHCAGAYTQNKNATLLRWRFCKSEQHSGQDRYPIKRRLILFHPCEYG